MYQHCTTPGCPGLYSEYGSCPCGCINNYEDAACKKCGNEYGSDQMEWGGNYSYCNDDEFFCDEQCITDTQIWRITKDGENIFEALNEIAA